MGSPHPNWRNVLNHQLELDEQGVLTSSRRWWEYWQEYWRLKGLPGDRRRRFGKMQFEPYDPTWLVDLARQQRPDLTWLIDSLAACTQCHWKRRRIYVHFVNPEHANQPGADWQYRETISLDHPEYGHIKLDVLNDNRVGGIEFYDRLFASGKPKQP